MKLTKPKSVYVQVRGAKESKTLTVYDASVADVHAAIKALLTERLSSGKQYMPKR